MHFFMHCIHEYEEQTPNHNPNTTPNTIIPAIMFFYDQRVLATQMITLFR